MMSLAMVLLLVFRARSNYAITCSQRKHTLYLRASEKDKLQDIGVDSLALVELRIELEAVGIPKSILAGIGSRATIGEVAYAIGNWRRAVYPRVPLHHLSTQPKAWLLREYPVVARLGRVALPTLSLFLWIGPTVMAAKVFELISSRYGVAWASGAFPIVFFICFALLAAGASLPFQWSIRPVRCRTSLGVPLYLSRRCYGMCWTSLYYFKACYSFVLAIPWLKKLVFRLFGYKGASSFTLYPDTWIRDLPLLEIGSGAYLSNRATLGTNVLTTNGEILVGSIRLGEGAVVGHLAVVGLGSDIGPHVNIGVGSHIGIGVRVGQSADIESSVKVNHYAIVGEGARVGAGSFIGSLAEIPAKTAVPPATAISDETHETHPPQESQNRVADAVELRRGEDLFFQECS